MSSDADNNSARRLEQRGGGEGDITITPYTSTSHTTTARLSFVESLRAGRLHDYSGLQNPRSDDEMRNLWERWRGTRGKTVTANLAVTQESLDASWTAFLNRWYMDSSLTQ